MTSKTFCQLLLDEHFNNLNAVSYTTPITTSNFDVSGWTVSTPNRICITEAGSVSVGISGNSGADLSTPPLDLSGSFTKVLSFKLKYYGTSSIGGSPNSKVIILLDNDTVFNGARGIVTQPAGSSNYSNTAWTEYSIILSAGAVASKITFKGTTSNHTYQIDDVVVSKGPPPSITTLPATAITYNTATVGGNINSTGIPVSNSGVCYSLTNNNPTLVNIAVNTNPLVSNGNFNVSISGLNVSTTVYYRAYIVGAAGVFYGAVDSFTTLTPVYQLVAAPTVLNYGDVAIGANRVLSFALTGNNISQQSGDITLTAPGNFSLSTNLSGPFTSTLSIPYSGGNLPVQTIYVQFSPTALQAYSGTIVLSGAGIPSLNIINCQVLGNAQLPTPALTSNIGNDFWLGFGYQEKMNQKSGNNAEAKMSVYVTTGDRPATVHVDLTSGGYSSVFTIPANSFHEFTGFPTGDPANNLNLGGFPDSRLYSTGISKKSIHVYSEDGSLIGVFLHSYTNNTSAAGALIFPVNTWNTSYTVQAFGGKTNSDNPNSFFFVIANEDSTLVTFTPTQPILDSNSATLFSQNATTATNTKYFPGNTYTIRLNKGEVFNAMGGFGSDDSTGLDLSGTRVSTNCKKIAVFGGNGRCWVNPSGCNAIIGSDHLIQQMFPSAAWGLKYLTKPTKTHPLNYYRIYVQDPTTTSVWVNDPGRTNPLANLIANSFYEIQSTQPLMIEGNHPISVTQFMTTPGCNSPGVNGGPEMIILSPIEQAISKTIVYSSPFKTTGVVPALPNGTIGNCASFINVIIPTAAVSTFKLDGLNVADTGVATIACSLSGVGNCASLSAGNLLLPMSAIFSPHPQDNAYSTANFWVATNVKHTLEASSPFNAIAYGVGAGESYGFNAGALVRDLSAPLIIKNPFADSMNSESNMLTTCRGNDFLLSAALPFETNNIRFSFRSNPNISPNTDTVISSATGNLPYSSTYVSNGQRFYVYQLSNPYRFSSIGDYPVDVVAKYNVSDGSCLSGSFKNYSYIIRVVEGINADFSINYNPCLNDTIALVDLSTSPASPISGRYWTYNDSRNTFASPFDTLGIIRISNPSDNVANNFTLTSINQLGCFQKITKQIPIVSSLPPVSLNLPFSNVCSNTSSVTLTGGNPATTPGLGNGRYYGPGVDSATGIFYPSLAGIGIHEIKYLFYNASGCKDSATANVEVKLAVNLVINPVNPICDRNLVPLSANVSGGVFTGNGVTGNNFDPVLSGVGTHQVFYSISGNTCAISDTIDVKVNTPASASVTFNNYVCSSTVPFVLQGGQPSTVAGIGTGVYSGSGVNPVTGEFNPSVSGIGLIPITYTYTTAENCVKSATAYLEVRPQTILKIEPVQGVCYNASNITLTANVPGGVFSGRGVTPNGTFSPVSAGIGLHNVTYSLPNNNCSVAASIPISVFPAPRMVNAGPSQIIVQGNGVYLNGYTNEADYIWSPSTGLSNIKELHPYANPTQTTIYTLTAINSYGCTFNDTMEVKVLNPCLDPSKIFTPNNDGKYDTWIVYKGDCFKKVVANVYNRWGGLVYHSDYYRNDWNGNFENKPLPDATYYYVLTVTEVGGYTYTLTGNVTIMR